MRPDPRRRILRVMNTELAALGFDVPEHAGCRVLAAYARYSGGRIEAMAKVLGETPWDLPTEANLIRFEYFGRDGMTGYRELTVQAFLDEAADRRKVVNALRPLADAGDHVWKRLKELANV